MLPPPKVNKAHAFASTITDTPVSPIDYLRMPAEIDAGSEDVEMIHADEEQTEAEMLREALALSSYENHAPQGKL